MYEIQFKKKAVKELKKIPNKEEFAILDYSEYQRLLEYIQDLEDLVDLRKAKEETKDEPTISIAEVKETLGIG